MINSIIQNPFSKLCNIINGNVPQFSVPKENNTNNSTNNELTENLKTENLEMQKALWEREDKIRKETQAREDTAYQRAVEDLRKSGINPNLINIQPANSGGGITQGTKAENLSKEELKSAVDIALNSINNDLNIQESEKDRAVNILQSILKIFS